ncbi:ATPase family protein associated with various cellular activities (AAA) [Rhizobium sp. PP-F2F-G36]|nr:ATPase family protein associated with various cellular activities (AAA) [Rhizobium sp. PP-F2F-G36]
MNRLSRLFVRRLRHLAARDTRRHASANGLIAVSSIDVQGHLVRRYTPAFNTGSLTFNRSADLAWLTRTFGSLLLDAVKPEADGAAAVVAQSTTKLSGTPSRAVSLRADTALDLPEPIPDRRAYATTLVGLAAPPVHVAHLATALLIARAITSFRMTLRRVVEIIRRPAPIIVLRSQVEGTQDAFLRLIEMTGLVPSGPYAGLSGDSFYERDVGGFTDMALRRRFVFFQGKETGRESRAMKRGLAAVLGKEDPILAIAHHVTDIPDQISAAADLHLDAGAVDRAFVVDLFEAVYGDVDGMVLDNPHLRAFDASVLTLDDLALALRPGRPRDEALVALRQLAACKVQGERGEDTRDNRDRFPTEPATGQGTAREGKKASAAPSSRKGKPSGAEVIHPQPTPGDRAEGGKPPVTVETLSGYGAARTWALDLGRDLGDYRTGDLGCDEMSTKLLLSGPPGTGKTSFARALCNTLQVPLVVTSVSTWLQGGHLNDVIDRMSRTFAEARDHAPCILFIDEIDGIGKRVDPNREYSEYWNAIVNKMLELLDGAVRCEGVVVVGATNRPEQIDKAIKRSGRLETHIEIPKPDIPALAGIIAHHLGKDVDVVLQTAELSKRQWIDTAVGNALEEETFGAPVDTDQEGARA